MTHVLYESGNAGKRQEVGRMLSLHGITAETMADLGVSGIQPLETGTSLEENAQIKIKANMEMLKQFGPVKGKRVILLADDTGQEIPALGGEPGIYVRRWKDHETEMTDEEIISHVQERMKDLHGHARAAHFRTVLAAQVLYENSSVSDVYFFEGKLAGIIVETPDARRTNGFPFDSLFVADDYGMLLADVHALPDEEKRKVFSHRERAIQSAIPWILEHR